jgi:hypothetical protein
MSGHSSVPLLARTMVPGDSGRQARIRRGVRNDRILQKPRGDPPAPAERRAAARGGRRADRQGLVPTCAGRRPGRASGGAVERKCVPLVSARRAHEGLARTSRRGGRGLRGRLWGPGACDRRAARRVERGPLEDEAPRSPGVRPGPPVPAASLAPNPLRLAGRSALLEASVRRVSTLGVRPQGAPAGFKPTAPPVGVRPLDTPGLRFRPPARKPCRRAHLGRVAGTGAGADGDPPDSSSAKASATAATMSAAPALNAAHPH